jgi:hypothetical protein
LACRTRISVLIGAVPHKFALGHHLVLRHLDLWTSACVFLVVVVGQVGALALEGAPVNFEFALWFDFGEGLDGVLDVVAGVGADGFEFALGHEGVGGEGGLFLAVGHWFLEVVFGVVRLAFEFAAHFEFSFQPERAVGCDFSLNVVIRVSARPLEIPLGQHLILRVHYPLPIASQPALFLYEFRLIVGMPFEGAPCNLELSLRLEFLNPRNDSFDVVACVGCGLFEFALGQHLVVWQLKPFLPTAQPFIIVILRIAGLPVELSSHLQLTLVFERLALARRLAIDIGLLVGA